MTDEPSTIMGMVFAGKKKAAPDKKLLPYKTAMCGHCGRIQVTQGEIMFRCRACNKSNRYRKKGCWNVKLKDFPTAEEAMIEAKRWAMEEGRKSEKSRR